MKSKLRLKIIPSRTASPLETAIAEQVQRLIDKHRLPELGKAVIAKLREKAKERASKSATERKTPPARTRMQERAQEPLRFRLKGIQPVKRSPAKPQRAKK
jgi:hypothetical protein